MLVVTSSRDEELKIMERRSRRDCGSGVGVGRGGGDDGVMFSFSRFTVVEMGGGLVVMLGTSRILVRNCTVVDTICSDE